MLQQSANLVWSGAKSSRLGKSLKDEKVVSCILVKPSFHRRLGEFLESHALQMTALELAEDLLSESIKKFVTNGDTQMQRTSRFVTASLQSIKIKASHLVTQLVQT